jgi:hypothetical protein
MIQGHLDPVKPFRRKKFNVKFVVERGNVKEHACISSGQKAPDYGFEVSVYKYEILQKQKTRIKTRRDKNKR